MDQIRLSICIATINRVDFLKETLDTIVPQLTDEVELIVIDSSSESGTENLVRSLEGKGNVVYLRRDLSFGQAYSKAVEMARGEYCWLFTDDDLLKPGAIGAVLKATRDDYSLILVNSEVRDVDFRKCLQERRVPHAEDRVYSASPEGQNALLADTGMYLTFIGAVVIRRALWLERIRPELFQNTFIHMVVIFEKPLPGPTLMMANPWIVIRYGNALWRARSFEIWMFDFPKLIWSFESFDDWAKEQVERREPWRRWRRLVIMRAMNRYGMEHYRKWLEPRLKLLPERILARSIASAPVAPLNLLARTFLTLAGKGLSLAMVDLENSRTSIS